MGNLELDKIQGNIVPGFSKDYQAFTLVRFGGVEQGGRWLAAIQNDLASAAEVATFKRMFTTPRGRLSATWVNVALSFDGLHMLVGSRDVAAFPSAFRRNHPPGFDSQRTGGDVHAIIILGADRSDDLQTELDRQREHLSCSGVQEVHTFCGSTLPGDQRGHEHFGFKDAISQPRVAGTAWGNGPEIAAGEFVLGQRDEAGQTSGATLPAWTQNGSFVAFVQLQQHVGTFRRAMNDAAAQLRVAPEEVGSWIVGRNVAGDALAEPPARVSHIGRAYSRWLPDANRHRILRRGIPYGPPLADGEPEDGEDRGLFFVAYQADLERQFEHVWARWLNAPDFPLPAAGRDALVGQLDGTPLSAKGTRAAVAERRNPRGGMVNLSLPSFVSPRYGGYFFAPGVSALSNLV